MVDSGPQRLQQRLDAREVRVPRARCGQALAAGRVLREAPDRRAYEGCTAGSADDEVVRPFRGQGRAVHQQAAGPQVVPQTVRADERVQHLPRTGQHDDGAAARTCYGCGAFGRLGAQLLQRPPLGGGDGVHHKRDVLGRRLPAMPLPMLPRSVAPMRPPRGALLPAMARPFEQSRSRLASRHLALRRSSRGPLDDPRGRAVSRAARGGRSQPYLASARPPVRTRA